MSEWRGPSSFLVLCTTLLLASPSSPLGGALLGAKPGDKVSYEAPGGKFTYEVKAIRPYEG